MANHKLASTKTKPPIHAEQATTPSTTVEAKAAIREITKTCTPASLNAAPTFPDNSLILVAAATGLVKQNAANYIKQMKPGQPNFGRKKRLSPRKNPIAPSN